MDSDQASSRTSMKFSDWLLAKLVESAVDRDATPIEPTKTAGFRPPLLSRWIAGSRPGNDNWN
jgi:hypothetical protein